MVTISVQHDLDKLSRKLSAVGRQQLPFATALALTKTGQAIRKDLRDALQSKLAAPRQFTLNSPFSTSATKAKPEVTVGIKDRGGGKATPAKYLEALFEGGERRSKAGELALEAIGALPKGWRVIPGAGIKLDRYGNIPAKTMREIIGVLRSGISTFSGRGKRQRMIGYFVVKPGARSPRTAHFEQPGIYRRISGAGRAAIPVLIFVQDAVYKREFDLPKIAQRGMATHWPREFNAAFKRAMATVK